jgi:hypothetical protein
MKIKKIYIVIIVTIFLTAVASYNKEKLIAKNFNAFFLLPDKIKSIILIITGKRSFSNLYNDYNVKFLPKTQYIDLDFFRKKTNIKDSNKVLWDKFNPSGSKRYSFYLEVYKDQVLTITRKGKFNTTNVGNLIDKNIKNKYFSLDPNLEFTEILDTVIIGNKIYISHSSAKDGCSYLEIYSAKIDKKLNFEIFKKFNECGELGVGAGRMQEYLFENKKGILISTASVQQDVPGDTAQDDNSIYGKILFIDNKTKNYEIYSKGHRNVQGLFVYKDIILATEHGPKGGDELNKIIYKYNYGWPYASYGTVYSKKYKQEYLKSHEDNGYEEPLYAFVPSIGISELIVTPENFDIMWKNTILITSLNGRSIYVVKFPNKNYDKVLYAEKIYIGERIRDIKYIDKTKTFILSLERTSNIGILQKK